jgi:hypothetical protein
MANPTAPEHTRFGHLLAAHQAAFAEWSLQVRLLQAMRSHSAPDSSAVREAGMRASNAQLHYRKSRDSLADFLLVRQSRLEASRGSSPSLTR